MTERDADVCLIVEGAYPYVTGGVSSWVHDLIAAQNELQFHLVVLTADDAPRERRYPLLPNVTGWTRISLQTSKSRMPRGRNAAALVRDIQAPLQRLLGRGGREDFAGVLRALHDHAESATCDDLMNSEPAFGMLQDMYECTVPQCSFLNYFWSWRSLVGGLLAVLLADLPRAGVYHAVSTGYAGLVMARAVLETGQPGLLTEHGIYTNERRIEIAMTEWMAGQSMASLDIDKRDRDLRDVWLDAFVGYSRTCYECSTQIITLYSGNQTLQGRDGAPADRMLVIPNGVDIDLYAAVVRDPRPRRPTVALIGRVVPIKDVKTYIRAAGLLRELVPNVRVLMMGPTDEDPAYFRECQDMVAHLDLGKCFEFTGRVRLSDYLGQIDVVTLTSLSEAQPLVLLEAGAAGVPSVATDVGACRDLIEGRDDEMPPLGPGGFIVSLSNPRATAVALADLLLDPALRTRCAAAMKERTRRYYSKRIVDSTYRALYFAHLEAAKQDACTAGGV